MRADISAGEGDHARVMLQPCLAMRYFTPPSLSVRGGRPLNPEALSVGEVHALLDMPMPHPNEVSSGTEARTIIERVSGNRVVWVYANAQGSDGKEMEAIERVDYFRLFLESSGDDAVRQGEVPTDRTLGDLLGTWLDMTRKHSDAFARAAKSGPGVEFTPVLMMTPGALQFFPFPEVEPRPKK